MTEQHAIQFMKIFLIIEQRFQTASRNHLRTPWWRPFKANRHLNEMHQATADLEKTAPKTNRKG